jgi:hypothetical protein
VDLAELLDLDVVKSTKRWHLIVSVVPRKVNTHTDVLSVYLCPIRLAARFAAATDSQAQ